MTRHTVLSIALALSGCIAPVGSEDIGEAAEALTGPAPAAPAAQTNLALDGSNVWSDAQGANAWSHIQLGDVTGDGLADLCGLYGNTYGCVRRASANTFFEPPFMEAASFADPALDKVLTVKVVDANGDGRGDLCGRMRNGIVCQISNGAGFNAGTIWSGDFTDAGGWNAAMYANTIGFPRLSGGVAVCGRGFAGIVCYLPNAARTAFTTPTATLTDFSNGGGWNVPQYYSTIQYGDVDADNFDDICARGIAGIHCVRWQGGAIRAWGAIGLWTTQFRDADGWSDPLYYSSVRLGDVNNDRRVDVCGRGDGGVYCGISTGSAFNHARTLVIPGMSNTNGFAASPNYYTSLRIADFDDDGRGDVCAVGPKNTGRSLLIPEIHCARSTTGLTPRFDALTRRTTNSLIYDRAVAGRIYSDADAFCWVEVSGDVSCNNHW
jgi:hypothetical protein